LLSISGGRDGRFKRGVADFDQESVPEALQ